MYSLRHDALAFPEHGYLVLRVFIYSEILFTFLLYTFYFLLFILSLLYREVSVTPIAAHGL